MNPSTAHCLADALLAHLPDTRRVLALGLSASLNAPIPASPRFGVFRM